MPVGAPRFVRLWFLILWLVLRSAESLLSWPWRDAAAILAPKLNKLAVFIKFDRLLGLRKRSLR